MLAGGLEARGSGPTVERVALDADHAAKASLSRALRDAAREALGRGGSVLLVLNRLGFARTLACAECGAVRRCGRCRLSLLYHRETRALACRLCGLRIPAASLCGRCRGRRLQPLGWGTERLEAEARQAFPEARVVRYDSTVPPHDAEAARAAFHSGAARVLVGTTMALRLAEERPVAVGALVLADATLNLPDFRAAERTFQLGWRLVETVEPGGSAWLQSFLPEHPALLAVARGEPERFYEPEWVERQELGYPPARRMARLLLEGPEAGRLARGPGRARARRRAPPSWDRRRSRGAAPRSCSWEEPSSRRPWPGFWSPFEAGAAWDGRDWGWTSTRSSCREARYNASDPEGRKPHGGPGGTALR